MEDPKNKFDKGKATFESKCSNNNRERTIVTTSGGISYVPCE